MYKSYFEAKQVGILYHFTTTGNLISILKSDTLRGSSASQLGKDVISTTRFYDMGDTPLFPLPTGFGECRITLNGNKLSNKYKIRPFNDEYTLSGYGVSRGTGSSEYEEMIMTDKVTNLSKYIIQIDSIETDIVDELKLKPSMDENVYYYNGIPIQIVDRFLPYKRQKV